MASPASPVVIQMPSHTNGAGTAPTTPKDSGDFAATAPTPSGPTKATVTDKAMSSTANLAQLLPTGTVLAYQALAPSFTNHGKCEETPTNQWLTASLVIVLATSSLVFSFTDSVLGRDQKLYYAIATPRGFNVFNFSSEEEKQEWDPAEFRRLRVRPLDYMHAVFTALVFLTVALSYVGLQNCFFPNAGRNTEELLKNLPLGMAFFSSFVFMIFPTKRKGIGYNDTTPRKKVVT
ncbi:hypothetical protein ACQ4PT_023085 [Festuca glaucescens]